MCGQGWRLILEDHISIDQVIDGSEALEHAGRYNPPPALVSEEGVFRVVYFSGSVATAYQEIEGRADIVGHTLIEFEYTLQDDAWIDLTDEATRNDLGGVTLEQLRADWRLVNANGELSVTQQLAISLYARGGLEALKVPSARDNGFNWVIFPDRFRAGSSIRLLSLSPFPVSNGGNSASETDSIISEDIDEDENNTSEDDHNSIARDLMQDFRLE